jgi:hypothetical protein
MPQYPSIEVVRELPLWVRLAFAGRCARRVWPLGMASRSHDIVVSAILCAEVTAAAGGPARAANRDQAAADARTLGDLAFAEAGKAASSGASFAIASAAEAAYAAACSLSSQNVHRHGPDDSLASLAAHASAVHALTAMRSMAASENMALQLEMRIRNDLNSGLRLATVNGWDETTPAPPSIFGPMWEGAAPTWWR